MTSQAEKQYEEQLARLVKSGIIAAYEGQKSIKIESPHTGKLITNYLCDFKVTHFDGMVEWIEVKHGQEDALWQLKKKLMTEIYEPDHPREIYSVARMKSNGKFDYFPFKRGDI